MKIEATYRFAREHTALLLGFDVNETQAKGTVLDNSNPGWFFVFEEAYGDVHFGMDDDPENAPEGPTLDFWDDLDWSHATSVAGFVDLTSSISVSVNTAFQDLSIQQSKNEADKIISFKENSADHAYALFQKPVRLSVHAIQLL